MAPLPRWSDTVLRAALAALALAAVSVPALLLAWVRSPLERDLGEPPVQPIAFDHRHHVRDDGIDCLYCHFDAERSPHAGVPDTALCMGCHGQIASDAEGTAPLRASWATRRPIAWRRVTDLPDFVFFDHSAHVRRGVGCETCHGRVDRMAAVYAVHALDMAFCVDCHRDPTPHLRSPDSITRTGVRADRARGERIARELGIDPPTHCSGCHR